MTVWLILLTIVVMGLVACSIYIIWTTRRGLSSSDAGKGIPFRKNVLILMVLAYGSLLGMFIGMVLANIDAKEAYNLISVPFVALIGGTLAVAKDLIE